MLQRNGFAWLSKQYLSPSEHNKGAPIPDNATREFALWRDGLLVYAIYRLRDVEDAQEHSYRDE